MSRDAPRNVQRVYKLVQIVERRYTKNQISREANEEIMQTSDYIEKR